MAHSHKEKTMIIASLAERFALEQFRKFRTDFTATYTPVSGYDNYDAIILSAGTKYTIETKIRSYPKANYTGWVIEKMKYDNLKKAAGDSIPLYITIHVDGIQIWNLNTTEEPIWAEKVYMNESASGQGEYTTKWSQDLHSSGATQYNYPFSISNIYEKAENEYIKRYTNNNNK